MTSLFPIIYEDASLLVINKPAGLVCHPTKAGPLSSLISRVRLYLGETHPAHLINRLDRETSGLILIAKTGIAALSLRRLWESRQVEKDYLAIVHGIPERNSDRIEAPLAKDDGSPVAIKDWVSNTGAPAITSYSVDRTFRRNDEPFSLLRIRPQTGRKHQIRIHLAWRGHPIVGDKLYGPDEQLYLKFVEGRLTDEDRKRLILPFHALHAARLTLPDTVVPRPFEAGPERWFTEFLPNSTTADPENGTGSLPKLHLS